ncbi:MAG: hypothetical protein HKM93_13305 [Desulfobacteraceae bacterium]|nr:hypothetical protein [Desulfobacteraceae bacterium]
MNRFILLGTQRTGSSALAKLINLHPTILCGLEWTQKVSRKKKISATANLLSANFQSLNGFHKEYVDKKYSNSAKLKWIGFKTLFSSSNKWIIHPRYSIALWVDQLKEHLEWLKSNRDIHIIHIVRNHNLEWLKSLFLAKTTMLYSGKKYPKGFTVAIDTKQAIYRLKSKNWIDRCISTLDASNPYCLLTYEEFKSNNVETAKKVANFLNCNDKIEIEYFDAVKQSKGDAKDYISNYSQLFEALQQRKLLFSDNDHHERS